MPNNQREFKTVFLIIAILLTLFVVFIIFRMNIFLLIQSCKLNELTWQIINIIVMGIYILTFGILGYKKAIEKKMNGCLWGFICAVLGVWGYLFLLMKKSQ